MVKFGIILFIVISSCGFAAEKPNVLFIAIDDLNHWVGHLGRNPQANTPNIDRLAAMGTTFLNAHSAVPACEPSRAAVMGGRRPWNSGCYLNGHEWKKIQPVGDGLSAQFLEAGYYVAGAGKIYHNMQVFPEEWTEYMPTEPYSRDGEGVGKYDGCLLYTSPSPRDVEESRMPSSA